MGMSYSAVNTETGQECAHPTAEGLFGILEGVYRGGLPQFRERILFDKPEEINGRRVDDSLKKITNYCRVEHLTPEEREEFRRAFGAYIDGHF